MVNALSARFLTAEFGSFVVAGTVATLVGQIALFGAHRGGLREAAVLTRADDASLANLRTAVQTISVIPLPVFALITAAVWFFLYAEAHFFPRTLIALSIGATVWLGASRRFWPTTCGGFGQVRSASLLEREIRRASCSWCQALFLTIIVLVAPELGLSGALASLALGYVVPVFIGWRIVNKRWRHVKAKTATFRTLWTVVVKNWHFASNLIAGSVSANAELWIAGLILSQANFSQFSAAQRLSVLLAVPLVSLGVVYSPVVSRLSGRDNGRLESLLRTGATVAAATTAVAIPMLLLPGVVLETVYGSGSWRHHRCWFFLH